MRPSSQKGRPSKETPNAPSTSAGRYPLSFPLPDDVLDAVSMDEIDALQQLYTAFMGGSGKDIHVSTQSRSRSTLVHVVFNDCIGSLGAICAAFASRQISISCTRAFTSAAVLPWTHSMSAHSTRNRRRCCVHACRGSYWTHPAQRAKIALRSFPIAMRVSPHRQSVKPTIACTLHGLAAERRVCRWSAARWPTRYTVLPT